MRVDYHRKQKGFGKKPAAVIFISALLLSLLSCPNPIEEVMVEHAKDDTAPVITIISPGERGFYASTVTISGTVTDAADANGAAGKVESLACRIKGEEDEQDIDFDESGGFACIVQTGGYSGEIEILLRATDWNGNVGTKELKLVDNGVGPQVAISTPEDSSYYAATVIVQGTVANSQTDSGIDEIASLSYEVLSSSIGDTLTFDDGTFSFQFPTSGLEGNLVIRITAEDHNGNTTERDLTLIDGGSGIPTLTVSPGNQQATLEWDPVPFSTGYTVYYTDDGTVPTEDYGVALNDVSSPLTVGSLSNGLIYSFRLKSISSTGEDNISAVKTCIPLGPNSLVPAARGYNGEIRLSWPEISGASGFGYTLLRSTDPDGEYSVRARDLADTHYTDLSVNAGTHYYYRIRPAMDGSVTGDPAAVLPSPFSTKPADYQGEYTGLTDSYNTYVDGNYAFVADGNGGLHIIDIRDQENPSETASISTPDARDVVVIGDYAYVADFTTGLITVDISNPSFPSIMTSWEIDWASFGSANSRALAYDEANEILYVAAGSAYDLKVISINTVTGEPSLTGTYDNGQFFYDVAIEGNYGYIACGSGGMNIVNLSTLTSVATHKDDRGTGVYEAQGVFVQDGIVYLSTGQQGLEVVDPDTNDDGTPGDTAYCSHIDTTFAKAVLINGIYAYVADYSGGLKVFDVSDPYATPVMKDSVLTTEATGLHQSGSSIYISDAVGGLKIISAANPSSPQYIGNTPTINASAMAVETNAGYAFVADYKAGSGGVEIFDIANPAAPFSVGFCTGDNGFNLTVNGNYLYIVEGNGGFTVYDISDPEDPDYLTAYTDSGIDDIAVFGDYMYTVNGTSGFRIFDISDPSDPAYLSGLALNGSDVVVRDSYVYITNFSAGAATNFAVIDVDKPDTPILLGTLSGAAVAQIDNPYGLEVLNGYAYIANGPNGGNPGLAIIDLSNPDSPALAGSASTEGNNPSPSDIWISGSYAILSDGYNEGLEMFDISDPEDPVRLGACEVSGDAYSVTGAGNYAFVAADSAGLKVFDLLP
jgi:hypothetical protein